MLYDARPHALRRSTYVIRGSAHASGDEVAHLLVDAVVVVHVGVRDAADLHIGGAAQDRAGVRVDQLVAVRPVAGVRDAARRLVTGVQRGQERTAGVHLGARGVEPRAPARDSGSVVHPGGGHEVVDVRGPAEVLEVV